MPKRDAQPEAESAAEERYRKFEEENAKWDRRVKMKISELEKVVGRRRGSRDKKPQAA